MKADQQKLVYLGREIDDVLAMHRDDAGRYKRRTTCIKITSVILSAFITVLLGLKFRPDDDGWHDAFVNGSLVLSAVISVISAYDAFFDPRSLWIRETVTHVRLKDLKRDFLYWKSGVDPETMDARELEQFKGRLDFVLEDTLKHWMKIRGAPDIDKYEATRHHPSRSSGQPQSAEP